MTANAITDPQVEAVLAKTQAANIAWMRGDASVYAALNTHAEDYTIMGPFGGPTSVGFEGWSQRVPNIVKNFQNGDSDLHLVASYVSGDLMVLVLHEQQHGEIGGGADQRWDLRVTQVYRREDGAWRAVHRHADPLARMRTLPEMTALARE
jgi:ketosteroid isomerase-like protein